MRRTAAEYRAPEGRDVDDVSEIDGGDSLLALVHLADGGLTKSDLALLQEGAELWFSTGGVISLERCFRLPSTHTALRKYRRDHWLRKAAALIDADGSTTGSQKLETEWNKFITRGAWNVWRDDYAPPPGTSAFDEALFFATRYNRSKSLTARRLAQILGNIFKR